MYPVPASNAAVIKTDKCIPIPWNRCLNMHNTNHLDEEEASAPNTSEITVVLFPNSKTSRPQKGACSDSARTTPFTKGKARCAHQLPGNNGTRVHLSRETSASAPNSILTDLTEPQTSGCSPTVGQLDPAQLLRNHDDHPSSSITCCTPDKISSPAPTLLRVDHLSEPSQQPPIQYSPYLPHSTTPTATAWPRERTYQQNRTIYPPKQMQAHPPRRLRSAVYNDTHPSSSHGESRRNQAWRVRDPPTHQQAECNMPSIMALGDPPPSAESNDPDRWPYTRETMERAISFTTDVVMSIVVPDASKNEDIEAQERIWERYYQEAEIFDTDRNKSWQTNLDGRILFSTIFSAILVPLLVESCKLLQPKKTPNLFSKDGYKIRVNAFWFGSLMLSFMCALLAIQAKTWLDSFGTSLVNAKSAEDREELREACLLRHYRYESLELFHVPGLIASLPMLLFTAFILFAVGLIDYLFTMNQGIAIMVSLMVGIILIVHTFTTILPIFTPRSPFKTPLSNWIGGLWWWMKGGSGSFHGYEMSDINTQRSRLEKACISWLKNTTTRRPTFLDAVRAQREFRRCPRSYYGHNYMVGASQEPNGITNFMGFLTNGLALISLADILLAVFCGYWVPLYCCFVFS